MAVNRSRTYDRATRVGLLASSLAALVWRAPNLFWWPRFHAEEGKYYFSYAFDHGVLETLVYVYNKAAYLNLITNIGVAGGAAVPLESAPLVTTLTAALVQVVVLLIILFGRSMVFDGLAKRACGCALVIFAPHIPAEVWLNTLQSQVFFGLITALILLENIENAGWFRRYSYRGLLLLAGLSGPYSLFLQPVFALRAFAQRTRECFVQLGISTFALLTQIAIYLLTNKVNPLRSRGLDWGIWPDTSIKQVVMPWIGKQRGVALAEAIGALGASSFLVVFLLVVLAVCVDWRRRRLRGVDANAIMGVSFVLMASATSAFSMGGAGGRYAVIPGLLVLFFSLHHVGRVRPVFGSIALAVPLAVAVGLGVTTELLPESRLCDGRTPNSWQEEVVRWRQGPAAARFWNREVDNTVLICPAPPRVAGGDRVGWRMHLRRGVER